MASEPNKAKEAEKPGSAKKKKGLPPVLWIAVGAMVGGAGTVCVLPKPKPAAAEAPKEIEYEEVHFADKKMLFSFNPKAQRGSASARVSFTFTVKLKKEKGEEERIKKLLDEGWGRARSRVLEILTAQTTEYLKSSEGKLQMRRMIQDELTVTLFRKAEATVLDVYWDEFFVGA